MDLAALRTAWIAAFGAVLVGPVVVQLMTAQPVPMWTQLSTTTGLLATSAFVGVAVLPSRVRSISRAFGIEGVIEVHRALGVLAVSLVLVHLACVVASDPARMMLLVPGSMTPASKSATTATVAMCLLIGLALTRAHTKHLPYELWRWSHIVLAGVTIVGSALHTYFLDKLVRDGLMGFVLAVIAVLVLAALTHRWVLRAMFDPAAEFLVREVRPESPTINTLVLQRPKARHAAEYDAPWSFCAGQFAWIRLGESALAEEHPFTIASSADDPDCIEFTIRQHDGGFTAGIAALQPGESVWVDGPYGAFTVEDAKSKVGIVLIAGGVGVTPMMSILRTAAGRRDPRRYHLVLVVAKRDDVLFRSELSAIASVLDLQVTEVLRTRGGDDVGALLTALGQEATPAALDYFVCGSPTLVSNVFLAMEALDVPADNVRTEQFDFA